MAWLQRLRLAGQCAGVEPPDGAGDAAQPGGPDRPPDAGAVCACRGRRPPRPEAVAPAEAEGQPPDEPARITQTLRQTQGNVMQAARVLGLSRKALRYRMQRYGMARRNDEGQDARGRPVRRDPRGRRGAGPAWEQKPVAVLAIEVTWPAAVAPDPLHYEPWTVHARWEHTVMEKVQGFGGVVLQRGPSLLLVAFGLPRTLEQLPHRAVQTAFGIRQLTATEPTTGERAPADSASGGTLGPGTCG